MPFLRGGLAARRKVSDDWRQDVYYSIYHDMESLGPQGQSDISKLKAETVRLRDRLARLQEDLATREENIKEARHLSALKILNLGKGKTLAEIQKDTGMSSSRVLEMIEPLTKSGLVASRYVSQGQFYFYPTRSSRAVSSLPTEEDIKKLRDEIRRLASEAEDKEEAIRRTVKLSVLRTLEIGPGKSAGQIARGTGMSIADVIGMMMAFVRSGLVEQSYTPQGFFYTPPIGTKVLVSAEEERALKIMRREVEEIAERKLMKELPTPAETRVRAETPTLSEFPAKIETRIPFEAQPVAAPHTLESTRARLELVEGLLEKMTVRELVLLRERINMELRKR
jgi:DNA-binding IclR family transcriptional regulator